MGDAVEEKKKVLGNILIPEAVWIGGQAEPQSILRIVNANAGQPNARLTRNQIKLKHMQHLPIHFGPAARSADIPVRSNVQRTKRPASGSGRVGSRGLLR